MAAFGIDYTSFDPGLPLPFLSSGTAGSSANDIERLASAVAALVERPALVAKLFSGNENPSSAGVYAVRMHIGGKWRSVNADQWIPSSCLPVQVWERVMRPCSRFLAATGASVLVAPSWLVSAEAFLNRASHRGSKRWVVVARWPPLPPLLRCLPVEPTTAERAVNRFAHQRHLACSLSEKHRSQGSSS